MPDSKQVTSGIMSLFGGVQSGVTSLQTAGAQLEQAVKLQLALSGVTAVATVVLVGIALAQARRRDGVRVTVRPYKRTGNKRKGR